jgi:hypothetical protein
MTLDISIRLFERDERNEIVSLLDEVFNGWPHFDLNCRPEDHWEWKYLDTPYQSSTVIVGSHKNSIISCYHDGDRRFKLGDKVLEGGYGCDLAVHPRFRGQGLFNRMENLLMEERIKKGKQIACSQTKNPLLVKSARRKNIPEFPRSISNMFHIQNIDLHLKYSGIKSPYLKKYAFKALKKITQTKAKFLAQPITGDFYNVKSKAEFGEEISRFWYEIKDYYYFIPEISKRYMNWRYADPRGGDYNIRVIEEDGRVYGYSVLRINKLDNDYPIGYIVDLLALPNDVKALESLFWDAISFFENNSVNLAKFWTVKKSLHHKISKKFGFVDIHRDNYVFLRPLSKDIDVSDISNNPHHLFSYQLGFSDII